MSSSTQDKRRNLIRKVNGDGDNKEVIAQPYDDGITGK